MELEQFLINLMDSSLSVKNAKCKFPWWLMGTFSQIGHKSQMS